MRQQDILNADKNIVERRKRRRDDHGREAVRNLRLGLSTRKIETDHFAGVLLQRHAKSRYNMRFVIALIILLGTALTYSDMPVSILGAWLVCAFSALAWSLVTCRRFLIMELETVDTDEWQKRLQTVQFVNGAVWAGLFALHPMEGTSGAISILVFASAMVLMALALTTSNNIRYGVLLTTFPLILVVSVRLVMHGTFAAIAMALVLIAAMFFFQRLGDWMRNAHLDYLNSKAERDQLIVELEAATAISDEARRRAEDANLAKSRFLATMSHELRTPLNAILGFSEVMSKEVMGPLNNEFYKEYAQDIHASGTHLLELINEILDLSRVEAGRYKLNEESTSLAHVAEEAHQMVKLKAAEKNIKLSIQIQSGLPPIWADARSIRQVTLNLLSNALKFTPNKGTIWLKVGWTSSGGQYISIRDSGPGIAEEEIPVVLSSFGQGSIAIKSAEQGTGLGLPIVQALMHMHDGQFQLKSKLREGTEVIASFPRNRVLEQMEQVPTSDGTTPVPGRRFPRKRRDVTPPPLVDQPETLAGSD